MRRWWLLLLAALLVAASRRSLAQEAEETYEGSAWVPRWACTRDARVPLLLQRFCSAQRPHCLRQPRCRHAGHGVRTPRGRLE